MNKILYTTILTAALFPAAAFAQINSTTEAETDTGGNNAGSGGVVETGSSSATVKTTNVVGGGGGTVEVSAETNTNGEVRTETVKEDVPAGEVEVHVSAGASTTVKTGKTSSGGEAKITVVIDGDVVSTSSRPFWANIPVISWFWQEVPAEAEEGGEARVEHEDTTPRGFFERFWDLVSFWN